MNNEIRLSKGLLALSPLLIFLGSYVGISIIIGDFYKIPLSVALLVSSVWGLFTLSGKSFNNRVETFAKEAAQPNVLYMIWIFILAGCFATLANNSGAVEATVAFTMSQLPPSFVLPGIFIASCFISMAIGTSVGAVVALTPLAVNFAQSVGADVPFFVAVVVGGSFFGDNLSFISDTTIAATRTQDCKMNEKFKANFKIVVPAAAATFAIYLWGNFPTYEFTPPEGINYWLVIPYLAVIVLAVAGINVSITLLTGIFLAIILAFCRNFDFYTILGFMGEGIDGMGNLIIITILATGMLGLIKASGGISFLLAALTRRIKGRKGAQAAISALVGIVNLCTANNTVAILTVGDISKEIADKYGIQGKRSASLLDTASCIVQCLIPYGAQTLFATSLAGISPSSIWGYLYYPWILLMFVVLAILTDRRKPQ